MPSRRIPPTLKEGTAAKGRRVTLLSTEVGGFAQPPLTYDDPRLRAFLSVTFEVLYDWNIQSGAIYFGDHLDAMLGLRPGGFPRHIKGWLERLHSDDRERVADALSQSVDERVPFRCEYRMRHADGSFRLILDHGVILADEHGEPANMIGAMRDVTAQREAELAMREATELHRVLFRLPSPAMQVDAQGTYLDADERALAFFERTRPAMLASTVRDDFPPEVSAALSGELDGDDGIVELDVTCLVHGRPKTLLLTIIPAHLRGQHSYILLGTDITAQRAVQEELSRSERALRRQTTILDERNTALRVLLEQREQDRSEFEQRIVSNLEKLIDPTLDRLSRALQHRPERLEVEAVRVNLREIIGPFAERLAGGHASGPPLTRREIEVANLVRLGRTSAEIAETLHVSTSSVAFHRANVRRKLGLPKGGPRLETHLAALGRD
jgi:DNA-binding CsgD family transcriptional regulator/PAS domain-containing protein